eukprot:NODE_239_length_13273_cov_0.404964.p6 type:complete len:216 gc:universal NODE_239_length_13273_cov_0.404964:11668-12315(+)
MLLFLAKLFKIWNSSNAVELSKPLDGSSRNKILGSVTTSIPMLTLLRCPPLMPLFSTSPMTELITFPSPRKSIILSTFLRFSAFEMKVDSLMLALCIKILLTVNSLSIISSCGQKPINLWYFNKSSFLPFKNMVPPFFFIFPVKRQNRVVLPAPEGPIIAHILPDLKRPDTLDITVEPSGNLYSRLWNSMSIEWLLDINGVTANSFVSFCFNISM